LIDKTTGSVIADLGVSTTGSTTAITAAQESADLADAKAKWADPTFRAAHPNMTWEDMQATFYQAHPNAAATVWSNAYPSEPAGPPAAAGSSGNWFSDFLSGLQGQ